MVTSISSGGNMGNIINLIRCIGGDPLLCRVWIDGTFSSVGYVMLNGYHVMLFHPFRQFLSSPLTLNGSIPSRSTFGV
jgi:hypothetical protein